MDTCRMDKYEIRRQRLILLKDTKCNGKAVNVARAIERDATYVTRMLYPEGKKGKKRIADDMIDIIEKAFSLSRGWLDQPLDSDHELGPPSALRTYRSLPIVGEVQGGDDGFLLELQYPVGHGEGYIEWPTRDPQAYALRVRGDSMHPRYRAGEFVIVEPSIEPQPGDDVVTSCKDGRKMLKQLNWIRDGEAQFLSINNHYQPITMQLTDIESIQLASGRAPRSALVR